MQSPVARLTTADPTVPGLRVLPGWGGGRLRFRPESGVRGPATSEDRRLWVPFPKDVLIWPVSPQTIKNQKSTSLKSGKKTPSQTSFSFIPVLPGF